MRPVVTHPRCYKVTVYSAALAADAGFDLEGFLAETSERHLRKLCARRGLVPTNITERFRGTWAEAEAAVAAEAAAEPDGRVCWAMAVLTDCAAMKDDDGLLFAVHTADAAAGGRD